MNAKLAMWVVLGLLLIHGVPNGATAADGPYYWSYGGYWPWLYPSAGHHVQQRPPYFALYPPVYYSYPVKRPYGLSPFAWSPIYHGGAVRSARDAAGRESPTVRQPTLLKPIQNPYVSRGNPSAATLADGSKGPRRIFNPYVVRGSRPAAAAMASAAR